MRGINWSGRVVLLGSLAIAATSFVAGLILVFFLWLGLTALGFSPNPWAMLEAVATAGAASLVLGGAFVAYRELAEVTNSRYLEVADRLFAELNSPANIEARRWVYQHLPDDPAEAVGTLTDEDQAAIKRVLNSLDRVSFLTQPGWIPEDMVMPWMAIMVTKAWTRLKPYVEYERQRRQEPDYYRYAQNISERCLAWRQKHEPDARIVWVKDAL